MPGRKRMEDDRGTYTASTPAPSRHIPIEPIGSITLKDYINKINNYSLEESIFATVMGALKALRPFACITLASLSGRRLKSHVRPWVGLQVACVPTRITVRMRLCG